MIIIIIIIIIWATVVTTTLTAHTMRKGAWATCCSVYYDCRIGRISSPGTPLLHTDVVLVVVDDDDFLSPRYHRNM